MRGWVERHPLAVYVAGRLACRACQLVALLLAVSTLLFLLLRLSPDPAAGRRQYLAFLAQTLRLSFGESLVHHVPALGLVLQRLPATLALAGAALALDVLAAVSLGVWLGLAPERAARRAALVPVLAGQGVPALVVGLLLLQVLAVSLRFLPGAGADRPASLVMPAVTLAWLLAPRAVRLTASSVDGAMREPWVRTARAMGATSGQLLWRHVLPNSLPGTLAPLGVLFAFLLSGSPVVESLYAWPGLGQLLVDSVRAVDLPVVEAAVAVIAVLVFAAGAVVDLLLPLLDPRLRSPSA